MFHLNLVGRHEAVLDVLFEAGFVVLEVPQELLLQVVVVDHLRRRRAWKWSHPSFRNLLGSFDLHYLSGVVRFE